MQGQAAGLARSATTCRSQPLTCHTMRRSHERATCAPTRVGARTTHCTTASPPHATLHPTGVDNARAGCQLLGAARHPCPPHATGRARVSPLTAASHRVCSPRVRAAHRVSSPRRSAPFWLLMRASGRVPRRGFPSRHSIHRNFTQCSQFRAISPNTKVRPRKDRISLIVTHACVSHRTLTPVLSARQPRACARTLC